MTDNPTYITATLHNKITHARITEFLGFAEIIFNTLSFNENGAVKAAQQKGTWVSPDENTYTNIEFNPTHPDATLEITMLSDASTHEQLTGSSEEPPEETHTNYKLIELTGTRIQGFRANIAKPTLLATYNPTSGLWESTTGQTNFTDIIISTN